MSYKRYQRKRFRIPTEEMNDDLQNVIFGINEKINLLKKIESLPQTNSVILQKEDITRQLNNSLRLLQTHGISVDEQTQKVAETINAAKYL